MMMLKGNNVFPKGVLPMIFILLGNPAYADSQPLSDATRGDCCTQHIALPATVGRFIGGTKNKKLVTDQNSLEAEVRRWQKISRLGWSDDDIEEVARYLNARYYHYSVSD